MNFSMKARLLMPNRMNCDPPKKPTKDHCLKEETCEMSDVHEKHTHTKKKKKRFGVRALVDSSPTSVLCGLRTYRS